MNKKHREMENLVSGVSVIVIGIKEVAAAL
jgi:hypothetical protein